jgi:hypothetical protein
MALRANQALRIDAYSHPGCRPGFILFIAAHASASGFIANAGFRCKFPLYGCDSDARGVAAYADCNSSPPM